MDKKIYNISQLNKEARLLLEGHFATIWVSGEISNLARPSSGHWYFSLKDDRAQVRGAMFRGANSVVNFPVKDGCQVLVKGRISLYEARGDYQLIVEYMEEAGAGLLQRAFEELKLKLQKEGVFDNALKKPLPTLPKQIGIITSATGAAVHDILTTLGRRFAGIPAIIYPTQVQGKQSAPEIVNAIEVAVARDECDVLIVARGGGSLEDLWGFNEESVARAMLACPIPIVSGIGHEVDFTIADFVADVRAATPTAAAETVSPDKNEWIQQIKQWSSRLTRYIQHKIGLLAEQCHHLEKRLQHPGKRLEQQMQLVDSLDIRLRQTLKSTLQFREQQFEALKNRLETVSPMATIARGYSIVRDTNGNLVKSVKQVQTDDVIYINVIDGEIEGVVR
jgi:exodeoxyribonuclease VII large subunit